MTTKTETIPFDFKTFNISKIYSKNKKNVQTAGFLTILLTVGFGWLF